MSINFMRSIKERKQVPSSRYTNIVVRVWHFFTQRFTIMLIPHSDRNSVNFQVNVFTVILCVGVLFSVILGFFYLSTVHVGSTAIIDSQRSAIENSQASLDTVLEEVRHVLRNTHDFEEELVNTLSSLGLQRSDVSDSTSITRGDLSTFFDVQVIADGSSREVQELRALATTLSNTVSPLKELREVLETQQSLLADIPNYWPVENGKGRVTMEFGPNIHPFTRQWYLHKGIDIAGHPGIPIVASANGKVTEMGYDPGYGFYVFIRHKYGFRTRYSHLQNILVKEGQDVVQGERIGTMGNTGISTGTHLDFILMLGTDVVDPAVFLKISNDFARGGIGTR
jgi:murein DD-endopeptidase MepM/ murein hydrolase activator NlpD